MTTYKESGVNIDAGNELVKRLKALCPEIGGFSGLYPLGDQYLVAGTDGVGTKLKLAFETNQHSTIGIDLVAMCVNDILTSGAKPLFFLDYYATSKLDVDQAEQVLKGIVEGCEQAECVLLGGETAEMPGFYQPGEYDISGFVVGVVDQDKVIDGSKIGAGDAILGIPSSGVHSNGFSLIRKICDASKIPELLTPTKIYAKTIRQLIQKYSVRGMAHITGGGITENLPRIFPNGLGAQLRSWEVPSIFQWLQNEGNIPEDEMYRTFNMGIGMAVIVDAEHAKEIANEFNGFHIGEVVKGEGVSWD
ncbi:MAG: Phosphoribosylformylglycinamidine cyclo-ligase [Chlamydiae bacterium]|nr:Phosphoribosylformylglycinamidine cyclo-ligase [Chlamydiota bacterium]